MFFVCREGAVLASNFVGGAEGVPVRRVRAAGME